MDLVGRCNELEAAKTVARQQVTPLLSGCQLVLQQHVLLQQPRHVLGLVQYSPVAEAAAATQVANMLACAGGRLQHCAACSAFATGDTAAGYGGCVPSAVGHAASHGGNPVGWSAMGKKTPPCPWLTP